MYQISAHDRYSGISDTCRYESFFFTEPKSIFLKATPPSTILSNTSTMLFFIKRVLDPVDVSNKGISVWPNLI